MSSVGLRSLLLSAAILGPAFLGAAAAVNWQPDDGDWSGFRRDAAHGGATGGKGAFTTALADLRVKWERTDDPGYWVPPVAADLDGDGSAEIVASVGNASADPTNLQNPVSVEAGLNVVNGRDGTLRWSVAPQTGYLDFYSPVLGDIDNDGRGEIVWFHAQPLTGTSLTNRLVAYEADGTQKWAWSDTGWGSRIALPLTAQAIGNVDGEGTFQEVVFTLLLAQVTTTIQGGKVNIAGTNPEYRVIALNGEGSSATKSWEKVFTGKATASNAALADLNGDGTLDVVHGVGARSGTLIETSAAAITVSADFADDKLRGWHGGTTGTEAFHVAVPGYNPGELGTAPALVDLEGDGSVDIVQPLWVREIPAPSTSTSVVLVLNADGTEKWRTTINGAIAATIAQVPPAIADLNADGKKDIVVQVGNGAAADRYRLIALRHDGTVLWRGPSTGREFTGAPAIGDLTGDGKPEIVAVSGTNLQTTGTQTLFVYNGQTGAELLRKTFEVGYTVGGPLLVDLDGDDDGRLEILLNTGFWGGPGKLIALEPELADLRLTEFVVGGAEHLHGVPETVSAKVTNLGSRTATGATVRFLDGAATVHETTVSLAPGAAQTVSFAWTPDAVGARTLRALADPDKALPEWAETDNEQQRSVTVRAPDFRFAAADPGFSDPAPGVGDTITVTATLSNVGGKDGTGVLVRFLDGTTVFHEETVNVAKGASRAFSVPLLVEGEFDRSITVVADPLGGIVEENEADNQAARLLDVVFIAPDFTLADLGFSNPTPGADETIQVSVRIDNVGSKDAQGVVVRFLDEGTVFAERTVADLPEGGSATVTADLLVVGEFVHTVVAAADPLNAINEEREDNNVVARLLDVLAPDLSVAAGDIAFSDPNPDEFDQVVVTVTVRNVGTGGKVPQNIGVALLDGGVEVATGTIPSLPAGTAASVDLEYVLEGLGPRTLGVVVDGAGAVNELNELNNAASRSLVVGKLDVDVAMDKANFGLQEQATGVATVTFRSTGKPLANAEFLIPVEYVLRTATGAPPAQQAVDAVVAALAAAGGTTDQHLRVCSLGRCVEATVDAASQAAQLLSPGAGAAGEGVEVRFRLATIEAKTNALGRTAFVVPLSLLTTVDALEGSGGATVCVTGVEAPAEVPPEAPVPPPGCVQQPLASTALPAAGNLPGRYRATALAEWHGFGFRGATEYNHV